MDNKNNREVEIEEEYKKGLEYYRDIVDREIEIEDDEKENFK